MTEVIEGVIENEIIEDEQGNAGTLEITITVDQDGTLGVKANCATLVMINILANAIDATTKEMYEESLDEL